MEILTFGSTQNNVASRTSDRFAIIDDSYSCSLIHKNNDQTDGGR